jgi:hypothetical protein
MMPRIPCCSFPFPLFAERHVPWRNKIVVKVLLRPWHMVSIRNKQTVPVEIFENDQKTSIPVYARVYIPQLDLLVFHHTDTHL